MTALRRLLAEILTPTDGDPYLWAVIALGHVMLGAMLQSIVGAAGAGLRLALALAYWLSKERGDLRRGGPLRDGLIDSAFVAVGAFYNGDRWWPIAVMLTVTAGAWIKETRRTMPSANAGIENERQANLHAIHR